MAVKWYGKEVTAKMRAGAAKGLMDAAEHVLEEANRTVPLDEGTLMRSGVASLDEKQLIAAVSYDTPYAIRQHEATHYRHAPGRRAKWLELTLHERYVAVRRHIANAIRQAMR